jgi:hypothetical protein
MNLGTILLSARTKLDDMKVRLWSEPSLVYGANEGKNELMRLIRSVDQDFFLTSVSGTISTATANNPSEITLPADFAQFKDLTITTATYEKMKFSYLDRADQQFKDALTSQPQTSPGTFYYYDIIGTNTLQVAPGLTVALGYKLYYIQTIPDMVGPSDTPTPIPEEYHDWIVNFVVAEALRSRAQGPDPRLSVYDSKLATQGQLIKNAVINRRVPQETKYATGYMEDLEGA